MQWSSALLKSRWASGFLKSRWVSEPRKPRWLVHALIVGTVLVMACGWVGGNPPTPTATGLVQPPASSPSPAESKPIISPPPSPSPSPAPSPSPFPAAVAGDSYVVAEGDTLATIAEKFYGDSSLWRRIYDANASAIGTNPDNVKIGTTLRIPPKP